MITFETGTAIWRQVIRGRLTDPWISGQADGSSLLCFTPSNHNQRIREPVLAHHCNGFRISVQWPCELQLHPNVIGVKITGVEGTHYLGEFIFGNRDKYVDFRNQLSYTYLDEEGYRNVRCPLKNPPLRRICHD